MRSAGRLVAAGRRPLVPAPDREAGWPVVRVVAVPRPRDEVLVITCSSWPVLPADVPQGRSLSVVVGPAPSLEGPADLITRTVDARSPRRTHRLVFDVCPPAPLSVPPLPGPPSSPRS